MGVTLSFIFETLDDLVNKLKEKEGKIAAALIHACLNPRDEEAASEGTPT